MWPFRNKTDDSDSEPLRDAWFIVRGYCFNGREKYSRSVQLMASDFQDAVDQVQFSSFWIQSVERLSHQW